jgi:hypothetical protein
LQAVVLVGQAQQVQAAAAVVELAAIFTMVRMPSLLVHILSPLVRVGPLQPLPMLKVVMEATRHLVVWTLLEAEEAEDLRDQVQQLADQVVGLVILATLIKQVLLVRLGKAIAEAILCQITMVVVVVVLVVLVVILTPVAQVGRAD